MRNKLRVALAATAVCALAIGTAAPAGAQEEPAALGFAVDKTQAQPGALVLGKANAADVAEHCVTDLEEFQARFSDVTNLLGDPNGELFQTFFPTGQVVVEDHAQLAYFLLVIVTSGIAFNFQGAADDAFPQTFVMTFADIATQEPVGERGNFDPNTGDGSVVVPDIAPGNWAVAAACVGPSVDVATLEAGINAAGEFLAELGVPPVDPNSQEFRDFAEEFLGPDFEGNASLEFIRVIGPDLLEPIMVPDAFGAVLFCILDAEGNCPGEEPPPPPGEPPPPPSEEPAPAQPIVAVPAFTG